VIFLLVNWLHAEEAWKARNNPLVVSPCAPLVTSHVSIFGWPRSGPASCHSPTLLFLGCFLHFLKLTRLPSAVSARVLAKHDHQNKERKLVKCAGGPKATDDVRSRLIHLTWFRPIGILQTPPP
jgi:hypothetical protein